MAPRRVQRCSLALARVGQRAAEHRRARRFERGEHAGGAVGGAVVDHDDRLVRGLDRKQAVDAVDDRHLLVQGGNEEDPEEPVGGGVVGCRRLAERTAATRRRAHSSSRGRRRSARTRPRRAAWTRPAGPRTATRDRSATNPAVVLLAAVGLDVPLAGRLAQQPDRIARRLEHELAGEPGAEPDRGRADPRKVVERCDDPFCGTPVAVRVARRGRRRAPPGSSSTASTAATMRAVSVPTSVSVPAPTPSPRSVLSRATSTGTPSAGASSWMPPESVRMTAALDIRRANCA